MPRLVGVNIPDNKHIEIALTYIYGIGRASARRILTRAGIDFEKKASELSSEEVNKLKDIIEAEYNIIEGKLRRAVSLNVKRLKDVKCWRGLRHIKGLPVRGQNTRINSRTVRGNVRRTRGSGRRKAPSPK
jgi:small subunit ribosomal protein S13